ncbi:MAG: hypothetical protein WBC33_04635 [Conexibacter sp.]
MTLAADARDREPVRTICGKGAPGRRAFVAPALDVPPYGLFPARLRRAVPPRLPEVSEPELVRHYVNLSRRNFDLDSGFYPLGSCTMKHNPRLHERVGALPGHARLHPLQHSRRAQGALELMWSLERALAEVSGLPHVSLQPSAGSHGERTLRWRSSGRAAAPMRRCAPTSRRCAAWRGWSARRSCCATSSGPMAPRSSTRRARCCAGSSIGSPSAGSRRARPRTLGESVALLERSALAREAFGEQVVARFAAAGWHEQHAFDAAVTDWELQRSFERL